jgi:hypothetical protein
MPIKYDPILARFRENDSGDISTVTAGLAQEILDRQSADTTLQTNINNEATARGNADTTLQNNINSEATTRGNADIALGNRINTLENNEFKVLYYAEINTTTGTITKPTNSTIILNDFPEGLDAVVETIINGEPSGVSAVTAGDTPITISSFDTSGNYTLSGIPSAYPVALIYVLKIKSIDYVNLTFDNIIESQSTNTATIEYVDQQILIAENNSIINALIFG